ncbi:MAG: hypothetical protein LBO69_07915 [Ignavibacteria bacterium]|jgi:hypothetical protein|nr:hypothetical protein [Ignavibacteria bacterium]
MKYTTLISLIFFVAASATFAQPDTLIVKKTDRSDTIVFNHHFNLKHPTIRLSGSLVTDANYKGNGFDGTLNSSEYSFGAEFGYAKDKNFFPADKWNISFPFFEYSSEDFTSEQLAKYNACLSNYFHHGLSINYSQFETGDFSESIDNLISVGFTTLEGAGYKFSEHSGIRLLSGSGVNWYFINGESNNEQVEPILNSPIDIDYLAHGFRFGHSYQSEVNFNVYNGISVFANAKRDVIFPRTIFWKYTGSMICYGLADFVVGSFTRHIKYSSPYVYPAVNFVLKSALNWGFTELQRKNMNWPFNTASPVMLESFNVGLQFEF